MKAVFVSCFHWIRDKGETLSRCFRGHDRCPGFTLIETLVATVILAVSLVLVMQLFSGALNSSMWSEQYTRGIFYAREKMDEILLAHDISEGTLEGEFDDGFSWRAEISRVAWETEEDEKFPYDSFTIKVDVAWDMGTRKKHFEIDTLKIVEKAAGDA